MTIYVDHEQRRLSIIEQAFSLFAETGFRGVTYQKIADRCSIPRTAIYKYFQNKEQIFDYAIKLSTSKLNTLLEKVLDRQDYSAKEKLVRILHVTSKLLADNRLFLTVLLDYLLSQRSSGTDVRRRVRRHTLGLKLLLERLLEESNEKHELFVPNPKIASAHLFGILESYVLNLTVADRLDLRECLALLDNYIELLSIPKPV